MPSSYNEFEASAEIATGSETQSGFPYQYHHHPSYSGKSSRVVAPPARDAATAAARNLARRRGTIHSFDVHMDQQQSLPQSGTCAARMLALLR